MNRILACLAIITFLCCLTGITSLDNKDPDQPNEEVDEFKLKVETGLMEVRTVVTDKKGRIVEGLTKEDFELLEEDEPQEISHFRISKVEIGRRWGGGGGLRGW